LVVLILALILGVCPRPIVVDLPLILRPPLIIIVPAFVIALPAVIVAAAPLIVLIRPVLVHSLLIGIIIKIIGSKCVLIDLILNISVDIVIHRFFGGGVRN